MLYKNLNFKDQAWIEKETKNSSTLHIRPLSIKHLYSQVQIVDISVSTSKCHVGHYVHKPVATAFCWYA